MKETPIINRIFQNNKEWIQKKLNAIPSYFSKMAKGQQPEILYIGCSDSRVVPNLMMGLDAGDVFVHRNIANLIPENDESSTAVITYAVEYLKIKHLIVCGHYGCGGVQAALEDKSFGALDNWLLNLKKIITTHKTELSSIPNAADKAERLVELNVVEQCKNISNIPAVKKALQQNDELSIYGWVFNIENGALKDLNI
jgi:carbonic anhydrase